MQNSNLKQKSITAAYWTFGSFAIAQGIRFASNLILTRLLAPEFFGLMAIVTVFMIGLAMFSDIGLGPNIIQSHRSSDQKFLDSAWSLQIVRGVLLWIACLIAAYPMSVFYNHHQLLWIIPVVGLSALISGFNSNSIDIASKNLSLKKVTLIDFSTQLLTVAVTIVWALLYPSIWALVIGSLLGVIAKLILSHTLFSNHKNHWCWDKEEIHHILKFGGWIFLSTVFGFFVNSSANLIIGKLITMSALGVFSIAVNLSKIVEQIYDQIDNKIVFPVLVKLKDLEIVEMRKRLIKIKLAIYAVFLPPIWILMLFGQQVIDLLFDHRYHNGGWILRIYALSYVPKIVTGIGQFYLANGNSKLLMYVTMIKSFLYFVAIFIGWQLGGSNGVIIGMALYTFIPYAVDAYQLNKHKVWFPAMDALAFVVTFIVAYFSITLFPPIL